MQTSAKIIRKLLPFWIGVGILWAGPKILATPANRTALERHFDRFLARDLTRCTTCHRPSDTKSPETLEEFPHNSFGHRLRLLGEEWAKEGKKKDLPSRLSRVAQEDADEDGVANETELLLGHNPGDAGDVPTTKELANALARTQEFAGFLSSYRWQPFESVTRPPVPPSAGRNEIDAFLAVEWKVRGLKPRPEASRPVLLRRLHMDLTGLNPTPEEQQAFLQDDASDAYERLVDRLLADSRHGERWARHWMDVWRYSDWAGWADGNQIRDSKPHIWRWRDWIVDAVNRDKPYDRMIQEMLAADELAPEDTEALRATGFLVRNYKLLSREQWLEDTVKHTSQAFMGLTVGCAKCHDHMFDPITQKEYYAMRAIFEPHNVRTDRIPGQLDRAKDGLVRAFDATPAPTYFFVRGDERQPLTNEVIQPGIPSALGGRLDIREIPLPESVAHPDRRDFVVSEVIAASRDALVGARETSRRLGEGTNASAASLREAELALDLAEKRHASLSALIDLEKAPDDKVGATNLAFLQRQIVVAEAHWKQQKAQMALADAQSKAVEAANRVQASPVVDPVVRDAAEKAATALAEAGKKSAEATKLFAEALSAIYKPRDAAYKPREAETYPATSTGRRLAFAKWVTDPRNPLTARVAVNQLWQQHFGRGLISSAADFGRNGRGPTHPQLLDWLASEFVASGWSMKALHRLILTSAAYRRASTPDADNAALDPDNLYLWRKNSRRLEAEAVRDNLLYVAGNLDPAMGGPDIDHKLALISNRRSIYLRHAAEKQAEFLQIFDGASVTECYERHPSVMPQQALAMANSELTHRQAQRLAAQLGQECGGDETGFITRAYERILGRRPAAEELRECLRFLAPAPVANSSASAGSSATRRAENLLLVLLNHNDFVTVR